MTGALDSIRAELEERLRELRAAGKLLEAQRLETRTKYDLEMLEEIGYCPGIENYSRHLDGRPPGSRPSNLMDYFPRDFLLFIDESHATVPQLHAMYNGDRSRKECLVEHGFRLPSALDNRPMTFEEFEAAMPTTVFVSATPGPYELQRSAQVVEQIIRPTGLVDPPIEVRPTAGQVPALLEECRRRAAAGERVLITTLTKRLAEHLAEHLAASGLRAMYLHSDLDAIERVEILRDLRAGNFDVLVGVNLLREGLDLPEVSMVAVLDADKEGFLRSQTSLIQTIGRAARNVNGRVLLFADEITPAMRDTIRECERRRQKQLDYNREHGITPETIRKAIKAGIEEVLREREAEERATGLDRDTIEKTRELTELEAEMHRLAADLRFEEAAALRDRIMELRGIPSAPASSRRLHAGKRGRRGKGRGPFGGRRAPAPPR
jgi:excinuclease ABC subunit B